MQNMNNGGQKRGKKNDWYEELFKTDLVDCLLDQSVRLLLLGYYTMVAFSSRKENF
jgi:hypothetical protein